jgi:hypothetical protein
MYFVQQFNTNSTQVLELPHLEIIYFQIRNVWMNCKHKGMKEKGVLANFKKPLTSSWGQL